MEHQGQASEDRESRFVSKRAVFFLLVIATLFHLLEQCVWDGQERHDFRAFYVAALAIDRGENPYDVALLNKISQESGFKHHVYPYLYTPLLASMLVPLVRALPVFILQRFWTATSILAFAVALFLSLRIADAVLWDGTGSHAHRLHWNVTLVFLALLNLLVFPVKNVLWLGQVDHFVTALLCGCIWADRSGRASWAGVFLAFATLVKSTPVLMVVPLFLRGAFRTLKWFTCTTVVLVAMCVLSTGVRPWTAFVRFLPMVRPGVEIPGLFPPTDYPTFSTASCIARISGDLRAATYLVPPLTVGILCFVTMVSRRSQGAVADQIQNLMFLIAILLVSPVLYTTHLNYTLPGVFVLQAYYVKRHQYERLGGLLLLVMLMCTQFAPLYEPLQLGPVAQRLLTSLNLYALIALLAVCVAEVRSMRQLDPC